LQKQVDGPHFNRRIYKSIIDADHDGYVPDKLMRRNIQWMHYNPSWKFTLKPVKEWFDR